MVKHTDSPDERGRGFESPAVEAAGSHSNARMSHIKSMAIGVPEAAALMGVSVPTVYRVLSRRELPRLKLGHRTLIRRSDVEAFLTSLEVKGRG
jgi:excisionase family DNA binding protein